MSDLFDYKDKYPHSPGHRKTATSKAGAESVKERAPRLRDQVLALLRDTGPGLSADECARLLHKSILSIRPRLSELHRLRKIYDSGTTSKNESGIRAIVWRAY